MEPPVKEPLLREPLLTELFFIEPFLMEPPVKEPLWREPFGKCTVTAAVELQAAVLRNWRWCRRVLRLLLLLTQGDLSWKTEVREVFRRSAEVCLGGVGVWLGGDVGECLGACGVYVGEGDGVVFRGGWWGVCSGDVVGVIRGWYWDVFRMYWVVYYSWVFGEVMGCV